MENKRFTVSVTYWKQMVHCECRWLKTNGSLWMPLTENERFTVNDTDEHKQFTVSAADWKQTVHRECHCLKTNGYDTYGGLLTAKAHNL